jgi:RHS repeat-associated protein
MKRLLLSLTLLWLGALAEPGIAADTVYYYYTNSLHSAAVVTDAHGNVVERTYYAPYGQVLNRSMRDGPGYTGHEEDPATGLVYMQQRYYDPQSGRFFSTDPVQPADDGENFNRYWYANDNSYRYTDSDGRCTNNHDCPDEQPAPPSPPSSTTTTQQKSGLIYKHGVPPGSPAVHKMLVCTAKCMGQTIRVTSTSESTPVHGPTDVHTRGLAADVTTSEPKVLMQCAANCGAVFQLNEYAHPSQNATGGHVHVQLTPGRHGATGPYYPQMPPSGQNSNPSQEDQGL